MRPLLLLPLLSLFFSSFTDGYAVTTSHSYSLLIGYLSNDNVTVWSLDTNDGRIMNNTDLAGANPSASVNSIYAGFYTAWMTMSPDHHHLYIANHNNPGSVTVVRIENQSLSTSPILLQVEATVPQSSPSNPVHMSIVDNILFTVSYNDNSFSSYRISPSTNNLTLAMDRISACTNAHQISFVTAPWSSDSHAVLVPCLGDDTILNYAQGTTCSSSLVYVCSYNIAYSRKGSGPRHLVKHPFRNLFYVMNEKDSSIATWQWDPQQGQMSNPVYQSSLPINASFAGNSSYWAGAEIAISNDAQYLYVSNRALTTNLSSTIGVFRIDSTTGMLLPDPVQFTDGDGDVNFPRYFTLTPDNRYLLVANQKGKSVTVFSVDYGKTGRLTKLQTYPTPGNNPAFIMVVPQPSPTPRPVVSGSLSIVYGNNFISWLVVYGLVGIVSTINIVRSIL